MLIISVRGRVASADPRMEEDKQEEVVVEVEVDVSRIISAAPVSAQEEVKCIYIYVCIHICTVCAE
jgi:hypothetical protein